jgi:hypothetical protein
MTRTKLLTVGMGRTEGRTSEHPCSPNHTSVPDSIGRETKLHLPAYGFVLAFKRSNYDLARIDRQFPGRSESRCLAHRLSAGGQVCSAPYDAR